MPKGLSNAGARKDLIELLVTKISEPNQTEKYELNEMVIPLLECLQDKKGE